MMREAMTTKMISTQWGIYMPGAIVSLVSVEGESARICLDNEHHPAGRCHQATVPAGSITTKGK